MPSPAPLDVVASLFDGIRPSVCDTWRGTWQAFVDEILPALVGAEASTKTALPGFVLAEVEGKRSDATCGPLTALAIDVDVVPDPDELLAECAAYTCAVYETPSSGATYGRVRVIVALAEPLPGELVPDARRAFAEALGLDPNASGVAGAQAHSQVMFAGRLAGTRERRISTFEGKVFEPPAVVPAKPRSAVGSSTRNGMRSSEADLPPPSAGAWPPAEPDLSAIEAVIPPAGQDGDRHRLVRALGGWLARRGFQPPSIARAVGRLPSARPSERAAQALDAANAAVRGGEAPGWAALEAWCQAYGDETTLGRLEAANRDPREPEGFDGVWSEWWAGYFSRLLERQAVSALPAGAGIDGTGLRLAGTGWPMILQKGTFYWIHGPETYLHEVSSSELIAAVARELSGCFDEDDLTRAELDKGWVRPVTDLRASYVTRAHTYDPDSNTLTLAALRWTKRLARRHAHIDRWLRALFGGAYEAGSQWLASLAALDRPAPCLYFAGPKGVGKSLLANGLAAIWGLDMPAEMAEAISDFNESTGECPIVFTDEGFPEGLDFSAFRKMITEHARRVNRKNRPKYTVKGCARFFIAANNEDLLRYQKTGTLTADDLEAIADRLLVVTCSQAQAQAARDALRRVDTDAAASHEIAEHVLWLAATTPLQPKGERMAAAPGGGEKILIGVVANRGADVLSKIHDALGMGQSHAAKLGVYVSKNWPDEVRVHVPTLSRALSESFSRAGRSEVSEFCGSLAPPGRAGAVDTRVGESNIKLRVIDRAKLDEARGRLE